MSATPKATGGRDTVDTGTYTIIQLAALLKCSQRHVHRLVSRGAIPGVLKVGRLLRFRKAAIDCWLAGF